MPNQEPMEYKVVSGNSWIVDSTVNAMLETGWEIISETDSRNTHRKFSGGKAVGGALLLGPLGLLAGGIGKNKSSGEVRVRLQRPIRLKDHYDELKRLAIEKKQEEKRLAKAAKLEAKTALKALPMGQRIDRKLQDSKLAKSPLTTLYWYKKIRNRKTD